MPHHYVIISDDIYTLDTAAERDDAVDALLDSGEQSVPVYCGPPGEEGHLTGRYLSTGGVIVSSDRERLDECDVLWRDGGDPAMCTMVERHCTAFQT